MYEEAFGDTVGFALSVLIVSGLAVSIFIMALARLGEYFVEYNERKDEEEAKRRKSHEDFAVWQEKLKKAQNSIREQNSLHDARKLSKPTKQQYDLKNTEIDFSINTKDAIVVTEVVYAD